MPYYENQHASAPREDAPQNYYPTAKVKLIVRFDEFADGDRVRLTVPDKTSISLKGKGGDRNQIEVVDDPAAPEGVRRLLLRPKQQTTSPPRGLAGASASGDGLTHELVGIIPQKATWKQNGIRQADSLTVSLRWVDAPIDPRVVRSCGIEFFLGTVSPEDFGAGIRGDQRAMRSAISVVDSIEPVHLVPDEWVDANGVRRSNRRFQGWVNKWEILMDEDMPMLNLDCQDSTVLLIKQPQPAKFAVDDKLPIDKAIANYLSNFPQLAGMTVEYRPAGVEVPVINKVLAGSRWPPHIGPPIAKAGGGGDGEQATLWDYVTLICGAIGHNVRVDDLNIVIQQVQTLVDSKALPRADDPYRERVLSSGTFPIRTYVYGINVGKAKLVHEYTKKEARNVELRVYNPVRKNTIVVRFPEKNDRVTMPLPGDGKAETTWHVKKITSPVVDEVQLKKIAEGYFNMRGRNELTVEVETQNLSSFGGGNDDPDLLDMKVGDAFQFLINKGGFGVSDLEKELSDLAKNEKAMLSRGFSSEFSRAYARAYTSAGFQKRFVLKESSVDWDCEEGVKISQTGVNYIEVRVDKPSAATIAARESAVEGVAGQAPQAKTFDPIIGTNPDGTPIIG